MPLILGQRDGDFPSPPWVFPLAAFLSVQSDLGFRIRRQFYERGESGPRVLDASRTHLFNELSLDLIDGFAADG
jgi:hypothetical protein